MLTPLVVILVAIVLRFSILQSTPDIQMLFRGWLSFFVSAICGGCRYNTPRFSDKHNDGVMKKNR